MARSSDGLSWVPVYVVYHQPAGLAVPALTLVDRERQGKQYTTQEASVLIRGACHCGNITFTLDWDPAPSVIPARACSCSFCTKHGGVWTSCPTGTLNIDIRDPRKHSAYVFGTRTAEFHVCAVCGVVPAVTSYIDGNLYAVVNVNAFDGIDETLVQRVPASFDGEEAAERLVRRQKGWIARVRITAGT